MTRVDLPGLYELVRLASTDCAGGEAARRAAAGADEGTLLWCAEQTAGRTADGKSGPGPPGNLYCALVLRPDYPNVEAFQLGHVAILAAGSAIATLLEPMTGLRYAWPHEILINDLPAGGVRLYAPAALDDPLPWLVVELMVVVDEYPPDPDFPSFNGIRASGTEGVAVAAVLDAFAREFLRLINRWAEHGFAPIRRAWEQRADGLNQAATIELPARRLAGTARGLDECGRLVVERAGGARETVGLEAYLVR